MKCKACGQESDPKDSMTSWARVSGIANMYLIKLEPRNFGNDVDSGPSLQVPREATLYVCLNCGTVRAESQTLYIGY